MNAEAPNVSERVQGEAGNGASSIAVRSLTVGKNGAHDGNGAAKLRTGKYGGMVIRNRRPDDLYERLTKGDDKPLR
jgi:hypothetical protein